MRIRKAILVVAAIAGMASIAPASAYTVNDNRCNTVNTMRASSVSFPVGSSFRSALGVVRSRFYDNPSMQYFNQSYDDTSVSLDNGQNEVWFTSSSTRSTTYWWFNFWHTCIDEADVVFTTLDPWTTSMTKTTLSAYGGTRRPFQTTAIHEYGHAAGIGHEDDYYNVMGTDYTFLTTNGSLARSYLGEETNNALVAVYGRASPAVMEDVSVTLFRWTGRSGEYSTHGFGKMRNSAGVEIAWTTFSGQRRYNVSRGQTVQVEFTFENNGETSKTVNVGYYISTDSTIATTDRLIATRALTLTRDHPTQDRRTITLPTTNLTSGVTYYLGVIVDYTNAVPEIVEGNNAAYHIIRVN